MANEFMASRHNAFATSEEHIFELVKRHTSLTPVSREKLVLGMDNEVYRVATKDGPNIIVRINRFGEVKPSQEIWAMEQSRDAGAPIPKVYFCGAVDLPGGEREAMVLTEVAGQPLANVRDSLSQEQLDLVLWNAGRVLRKIHSVKAGGFYHRDPDGSWDFPSGNRFNEVAVEDRAGEKSLIQSHDFSDEDFAFMLRVMVLNGKEFPCDQPVLNHGDYLPEHIFVNEGLEITGVIDFGMFEGADPIHDFAVVAFEAPRINLMALIKGYGEHEMFHDRFDLRLNLHILGLQMGHLAHETRQNNTEAAQFLAKGLRSTMDTLRRLTNDTPG